jgi:hypothetical protein
MLVTDVNSGVASSLSRSKSIFRLETGIGRIRGPPKGKPSEYIISALCGLTLEFSWDPG